MWIPQQVASPVACKLLRGCLNDCSLSASGKICYMAQLDVHVDDRPCGGGIWQIGGTRIGRAYQGLDLEQRHQLVLRDVKDLKPRTRCISGIKTTRNGRRVTCG